MNIRTVTVNYIQPAADQQAFMGKFKNLRTSVKPAAQNTFTGIR
jgi:hypothetical protein